MTGKHWLILGFAVAGVAIAGGVSYVIVQQSRRAETPPSYPPGFCVEHQIMEAQCPWCDASLIESLGWCGGHDVPEAFCSRCNPALIPAFKAIGDWCAEHGLPESQCRICNPEPAPDGDSSRLEIVPLDETPRHQRLPNILCRNEELQIRFASDAIAEAIGLEVETVGFRRVPEVLTGNAVTAYHGDRVARLSSRAPGTVQALRYAQGDAVEAGATLALIDSSDLGDAKAEFLHAIELERLAVRNRDRERRLLEKGIASESAVVEFESRLTECRIAVARARHRLTNLGLSAEQIQTVTDEGDSASLLEVAAPFSGILVAREAMVGEAVDPSRPFLTLADTRRLWAYLDLPERDARRVRPDMAVTLALDGLPGVHYGGRVIWIHAEADPKTRTVRVCAEVDNDDGLLRAAMLGSATVRVRDPEAVLTVPREAVQWDGCCNLVFVRKSLARYEPRAVHLGEEAGAHFVVERGLEDGDQVVTTGSFLLKTEIMKESIGAGCCEVNPGAGA